MLQARDFHTWDGTRLRWYDGGRRDGPTIVIANGLGGSIRSWRHLVARFERDFRIISWDYRGLYGSEWPRDRRSYEIAHHAADLAHLLMHAEVDAPIIVAWSMGVQVTLEFHRREAGTARAFIAIHGTHSHPLATAFDGRTPRRLAPHVYRAVRRSWRLAMRPAPRLARSRRLSTTFVGGGVRMGIMHRALDVDVFRDMGRDWVHLNLDNYCSLFEALDRHDGRELLPLVSAPTLVVAGGRDRFTPPRLSEEMAASIEGAELFTLPDATHFGLLEFPAALNERIARFLAERLADAAAPGEP